MFDLVHLIELALEEHKVSAGLRLAIHHIDFELLQSINYLEEVAMIKEEAKVTLLGFLNDLLDWDSERILVEVVLELGGLVLLQPTKQSQVHLEITRKCCGRPAQPWTHLGASRLL